MLQAVLDRVAFLRVKHKHLLQQAMSVGVGFREDLLHALLIALGQLADVLAGQVIANEAHVVARGRTQDSNCSFNLIEVIVAREKRGAA